MRIKTNFRRLQYFSVLAECLHFGKAAERLCITQPPLSRQIRELEEDLGVSLFARDKRNVALTPQGQYLYLETQKLMNQMQQIEKSVRKYDEGVVGQLAIGYVGAAMHCVLPNLLERTYEAYPEVTMVLKEMKPELQVSAMRSGELDVGFVRTPLQMHGLNIQTIHKERLALVVRESELSGQETARDNKQLLSSLADKPFIAFDQTCSPALMVSVLNICNQCNFSPRIIHQASQLNTVVRMVESGLGYSIVPLSVQNGYNVNVRFIELRGFGERAYLSMIYSNATLNPIVQRFVGLVGKSKQSYDSDDNRRVVPFRK